MVYDAKKESKRKGASFSRDRSIYFILGGRHHAIIWQRKSDLTD